MVIWIQAGILYIGRACCPHRHRGKSMPSSSTSGDAGKAFLAFSLGPVQSFIESAVSLRDLWSGSYILSWLTWHAMKNP